MANAPKVYDFPVEKVEDQLVGFLKRRRGESTVADMIAGTGLPKYQVEQAAKMVLDEYAGRLKVTESGELLYYFPSGMRSTVRGPGPLLRKLWRSFLRGTARVLTLLFKIWIVAMLIGYFVAFVGIAVVAVVASVAASAAGGGRDGRDSRSRGSGDGMGGFLAIQVIDLILRMWFWSAILKDPRSRKPREGRAFYKSVFGFVFGDDDPNRGWEEEERKRVIAYITSTRGVITLEELVALTGRETAEANTLMNRLLLEYEGEPGVTDDGTLIYSFPALMRTSKGQGAKAVQLGDGISRVPVPFSANKRRTNGWIVFFNAFNLLFGTYFLTISLTRGNEIVQAVARAAERMAARGGHGLAVVNPVLYSTAVNIAGFVTSNPVPFLLIGLGVIPVVFSILFFLVPLLRKIRLERQNEKIRVEALRRRVMARILESPSSVNARDLRPSGTTLDPKNFMQACRRLIEHVAAQLKAEPVARDGGSFSYRFTELERELADLAAYRKKVDLGKYDVGKTVFDSGA